MEILHDGRATEVDEVLAAAAVAGAAALPVTDVGEGVLDGDAFAEFGPTRRGLLALAQFLEEPLVGVDRYAATVLAAGTPCAQRTRGAGTGGELDRIADMERQAHVVRAVNRSCFLVQGESGLGEVAVFAAAHVKRYHYWTGALGVQVDPFDPVSELLGGRLDVDARAI